jgi:hypothetical protein
MVAREIKSRLTPSPFRGNHLLSRKRLLIPRTNNKAITMQIQQENWPHSYLFGIKRRRAQIINFSHLALRAFERASPLSGAEISAISINTAAPMRMRTRAIYLIAMHVLFPHRFTPEMLLTEQPAVSMVIDLTNTTKYYQPQVCKQQLH